jgi:DNA ligase 1
VFDVLALNGQSLIEMPLKYRKKIIAKRLNIRGVVQEKMSQHSNVIEQAVSLRLKSKSKEEFVVELGHFMRFSEQINSEGLVLKASSSTYNTRGTRSNDWVKLK